MKISFPGLIFAQYKSINIIIINITVTQIRRQQVSLASWPLGRAAFLDLQCVIKATLKKLPTFCDATISFCKKCRLRNDRRNSILMTRHYPDLGRASDWWSHVGNLLQPIITMEFLRSFLRHYRDFKIQRHDGDENVTEKVNLHYFSLYSDYSWPLTLSNVGEPSWSWISRDHIQAQKEK